MSQLLKDLGLEPVAARAAKDPHISLRASGQISLNAKAQEELGLEQGKRCKLGAKSRNGQVYVAVYPDLNGTGSLKLSKGGFAAKGILEVCKVNLPDKAKIGQVAEKGSGEHGRYIILEF